MMVGREDSAPRPEHHPDKEGDVSLNPSGLCQCGCGESAPLAVKTIVARGWVKGEPVRFVHNHHRRLDPQRPFSTDLYEISDCGYTTRCWCWKGGTDASGYGRSRYNRKGCSAHRRAWLQLVGPIPDGLEADHLCRNRACVNPAHMELVTHTENVRRGAHVKLSVTLADEMRALFAAGTVTKREVGRRFGVSEGAVLYVIRNQRWTH